MSVAPAPDRPAQGWRLWPRSLVGQILAAATLALLIGQLIAFALIVQSQRQQRDAIIATAAAAAIGQSLDRLALGLPLRGERRLVARPREDRDPATAPPRGAVRAWRRGTRIGAAPDFPQGAVPRPALAARVADLLDEAGLSVGAVRAAEREITPRYRRDGRRVARVVLVAAQIGEGRWLTVRAPVADPAGRVSAQLIGQTLILFALLLLPLLWIARRAARPLAALAQAARDAAPGQLPDVAEAGPADVRDLTRAFNALSARVRAMLTEKDRTLGAIGHDLRTPLAALRVRVERVDDPELRAAMSATIGDMATMLDDIVALARAGHPHESPVLTDLAALLAELADDYAELGRPVRLAATGAVASGTVRPAALRRALRNLIDNAVTYGGEAELGLEHEDGWLALRVADRGPGIAAERIADMLEPFARAEESRNRATGGAGLGLALAKAVAEAEAGRLVLSNRPGGGLLATILLPASPQT